MGAAKRRNKKKGWFERFGDRAIEMDSRPIPRWFETLFEILLGWVPLFVFIGAGVVFYLKGETTIALGLIGALLVITAVGAIKIETPSLADKLRLPAQAAALLTIMLLNVILHPARPIVPSFDGKRRKSGGVKS